MQREKERWKKPKNSELIAQSYFVRMTKVSLSLSSQKCVKRCVKTTKNIMPNFVTYNLRVLALTFALCLPGEITVLIVLFK